MGNQLDKKTTNCCKGIAAVIIMLHHISFKVSNLPIYIKPIWYIAFPIVGFFFFMWINEKEKLSSGIFI